MSFNNLAAFTRQLSNKNAFRICSHYSTSSNQTPSKIYELRVYDSHPKDFKKAVKLITDNIHTRLKHSKMFGFWTTEIGDSIFQLVHIWEYDSLSHRRKARAGLLEDTVWQTEFLPQLVPCLRSMDNALLAPSPGSRINTDFKNDPTAVYEFVTIEPGSKVPDESSKSDAILVGRFNSIFSCTRAGYQLWRYLDIDQAFEASWNRSNDKHVKSSSLLMVPAKFSPIS